MLFRRINYVICVTVTHCNAIIHTKNNINVLFCTEQCLPQKKYIFYS